jgi:anti-sigma factor RsiW
MRAAMGRLMGPMVTCRELVDFLWRYVEEDLTPAERKTFDRHLAMCRSCRAYLDSYRKTIALGRTAYSNLDAEAPKDVPEEIIQGILAARRAGG